MQIPIVTSIPPRMTRRTPDGADIGSEYLELCLESWQRHGFAPLSINSVRETARPPGRAGTVPRVEMQRDAAAFVGKPLVHFADMVRAAAEIDGPGVVALTNADILLEPPFPLDQLLHELRPGQAVFARRIDVKTHLRRDGVPYPHGFDFFAAHRDDLRRLDDHGFIFGMPWWDYVLPCSLLGLGVHVSLLEAPFAFHLLHSERWDPQHFVKMGQRFVQQAGGILRGGSHGAAAGTLLGKVERASQPDRKLRSIADRTMRSLHSRSWITEELDTLARVSAAVTDFFDQELSVKLSDFTSMRAVASSG